MNYGSDVSQATVNRVSKEINLSKAEERLH
jgi:arginine repressor